MKLNPIHIAVIFLLVLASCKKESVAPLPPTIDPVLAAENNITDSCSFTINNQLFTNNKLGGHGRGNAGTNLDTANHNSWNWSADSTQYRIMFTFFNDRSSPSSSSNNYLSINFVKKYHKNSLSRNLLGIKAPDPQSELDMFAVGSIPYALDFNRSNYQNGVALSLRGGTSGSILSYIDASAYQPTTIPWSVQNNSTFEITRFTRRSEHDYILEAKFSFNGFNNREVMTRVENGYLRLHLNWLTNF